MSGFLVVALLALSAPAVRPTEEARLAAHLPTVQRAFADSPCAKRLRVHLRANRAIRKRFPGHWALGMASKHTCEVWLVKGMHAKQFRYVLTHEVAHTAGWVHGPAMDREVARICRIRYAHI